MVHKNVYKKTYLDAVHVENWNSDTSDLLERNKMSVFCMGPENFSQNIECLLFRSMRDTLSVKYNDFLLVAPSCVVPPKHITILADIIFFSLNLRLGGKQ